MRGGKKRMKSKEKNSKKAAEERSAKVVKDRLTN